MRFRDIFRQTKFIDISRFSMLARHPDSVGTSQGGGCSRSGSARQGTAWHGTARHGTTTRPPNATPRQLCDVAGTTRLWAVGHCLTKFQAQNHRTTPDPGDMRWVGSGDWGVGRNRGKKRMGGLSASGLEFNPPPPNPPIPPTTPISPCSAGATMDVRCNYGYPVQLSLSGEDIR